MTKRFFAALTTTALAATALVACSDSSSEANGDGPLPVLAAAGPHLEILEWVDEHHDEFELDLKATSGGPETNLSVADGSAAANFFQHEPYLINWEKETGKNLDVVAAPFTAPISIYSNSLDDIQDIPEGGTIVIPSNPSNFSRGLLLLQDAGIIKLDTEVTVDNIATITDQNISENPKNIKIRPVEGEIAANSLDDDSVDAALINSGVAMKAGLDTVNDPIYTESPEDNPYVNILAANTDYVDDPRLKALAAALEDQATLDWIREEYRGSLLPVK